MALALVPAEHRRRMDRTVHLLLQRRLVEARAVDRERTTDQAVAPVEADAALSLELAEQQLGRDQMEEPAAIRTRRGRAAVVAALAERAERLPQTSLAVLAESALVPASAARRRITAAAAAALRIPAL
jgi:hypothetical protein